MRHGELHGLQVDGDIEGQRAARGQHLALHHHRIVIGAAGGGKNGTAADEQAIEHRAKYLCHHPQAQRILDVGGVRPVPAHGVAEQPVADLGLAFGAHMGDRLPGIAGGPKRPGGGETGCEQHADSAGGSAGRLGGGGKANGVDADRSKAVARRHLGRPEPRIGKGLFGRKAPVLVNGFTHPG